jgi:hypothetical protein
VTGHRVDRATAARYILSRHDPGSGYCFYRTPEWGVEEPSQRPVDELCPTKVSVLHVPSAHLFLDRPSGVPSILTRLAQPFRLVLVLSGIVDLPHGSRLDAHSGPDAHRSDPFSPVARC